MTIFVLAYNGDEFRKFCAENNLNPYVTQYTYLFDPEQLRGILNPAVILYGEYKFRKDSYDMNMMLETRNAIYLNVV